MPPCWIFFASILLNMLYALLEFLPPKEVVISFCFFNGFDYFNSVITIFICIYFQILTEVRSLCRQLTLCFYSLETTLRNFSCLTTGDSIMVAYNNKKYYIDIIESKPANAISIIETDCEVDFAPPLDYKEPEKPIAPRSAGKALEAGMTDWSLSFFSFSMSRRMDNILFCVCVACCYNWYWKFVIRGWFINSR